MPDYGKELGKAEDELFKKWNLEGGIYVDDEDSALAVEVIYPTLTDKYFHAKNMSEINNDKVLNNSKNEIVKYFNQELDEYAKSYNIEKDLIENVKKDVPNIVGEHFDNVVDKLFNDKTRNKLSILCNEWEKAYEKLDYESMDKTVKKIISHFQKPGTVYRDSKLENKLEEIVTKNQFIQNKLAKGEDGRLNEIEEKVIMKDINPKREKEDSRNSRNDIEKFFKELEQKLKER